MSDSEELMRVVKDLLEKYNVELTDFIQGALQRVAGEFLAAKLIMQETVDSLDVTGVDNAVLAKKVLKGCRPSLVHFPEENFPKFIAVLRNYVTMEQLAANMESEFKDARKSCNTMLATQLTSLPKCMYSKDSFAMNVCMVHFVLHKRVH